MPRKFKLINNTRPIMVFFPIGSVCTLDEKQEMDERDKRRFKGTKAIFEIEKLKTVFVIFDEKGREVRQVASLSQLEEIFK